MTIHSFYFDDVIDNDFLGSEIDWYNRLDWLVTAFDIWVTIRESGGGPPTTSRVTPRYAGLLEMVNIGPPTRTRVTPGNPT